jgi:hypothetical protein
VGFSTANKNAVLDKLFGATNFTPSGTLYVALSTTEPTDVGANVNEPSGGGYDRVAVANDGTNWVAASAGEKSNANDIIFDEATSAWGIIGWWALYDAASGGVFQHWGALQTARIIGVGDVFRFLAGDLVIRLRSDD